ncbi:hypothetical protein C8J57DRAFT_1296366 [Mycena rebaudengoi]|nr:hypothetical protein C8J57DRAFT_1296366 [Mycena rebaudengoi]
MTFRSAFMDALWAAVRRSSRAFFVLLALLEESLWLWVYFWRGVDWRLGALEDDLGCLAGGSEALLTGLFALLALLEEGFWDLEGARCG